MEDNTAPAVHVKTSQEKALVRRLDMFLMTFGCLSQVIKYLDQSNINNAYVTGMKEDLSLYGNELNYFTTYFNVGYCVMLIPSQIIITRVRPSLWLPGLEISWGILTGLIAACSSAKQIYAIRTFLGVCESSAYPGMMVLMMNWYTPMEIGKRMAFYHSCQAVGSMMSGALAAAIQRTLDGSANLAGWRWLFIINSIMTVVLGMAGFWMIPDAPNRPNPRALWFSEHHAKLSMDRLSRYKRAEPKKMKLTTIKRTFWGPLVWLVTILYVATVLASYGIYYFGLWLKSLTNADGTQTWSTEMVNTIPIGGSAINVVFVWIWGSASDTFGRAPVILVQAILGLIPAAIMTAWNVPRGAKYFSFFLSFTVMGTAPPIFAWLSDLCPHDAEQRALVLGFAITMFYAISAWSQVLIWPASQAPHYKCAWQVSIGLWIFVIFLVVLLKQLEIRYIRLQNAVIAAEKTSAVEHLDIESLGKEVDMDRNNIIKGEADEVAMIAKVVPILPNLQTTGSTRRSE